MDIIKRNNFQKSFEQFGGLGLSSKFCSIQKPTSITQSKLCQVYNLFEEAGISFQHTSI